jgi:hypothetical protein
MLDRQVRTIGSTLGDGGGEQSGRENIGGKVSRRTFLPVGGYTLGYDVHIGCRGRSRVFPVRGWALKLTRPLTLRSPWIAAGTGRDETKCNTINFSSPELIARSCVSRSTANDRDQHLTQNQRVFQIRPIVLLTRFRYEKNFDTILCSKNNNTNE